MFKYVALSIPIFIVMIAFEALASWLRRDENYRFSDAITNLSLGLGQTVIDALLKTLLILLYIAVYDHVALVRLPDNWVTFVTMLLLYDFIYYWFHRFSHRINFLWAVHIVHHSSEDFNFTVALRQAWLHKTVAFAFFAPFPFLGLSPLMFAYINAFQTLYQFWLHTKYIGKLGPLEWIFVTPSHHRVHHSFAQEHLDKNFGGTLIVWDRLFGSFAEEKVSPVFGITKPVQTWNPLWANLHYWKDLFVMASKTEKWKEKIQVFFRPPDWKPEYAQKEPAKTIDLPHFKKFDTPISPALGWYILLQFSIMLFISLYILLDWTPFTFYEKLFLVTLILWSLIQFGFLISQRSGAVLFELLRLGLLYFVLFYFLSLWTNTLFTQIGGLLCVLLFATWVYLAARFQSISAGEAVTG